MREHRIGAGMVQAGRMSDLRRRGHLGGHQGAGFQSALGGRAQDMGGCVPPPGDPSAHAAGRRAAALVEGAFVIVEHQIVPAGFGVPCQYEFQDVPPL